MAGVGAAVASGLGLLIAVSRSVANIPGGFAATASLAHDGVPRRQRLLVAGLLVVTTIEDVVPEGDASPRLSRWISTTAFAAGFVGLAVLSTYFN